MPLITDYKQLATQYYCYLFSSGGKVNFYFFVSWFVWTRYYCFQSWNYC